MFRACSSENGWLVWRHLVTGGGCGGGVCARSLLVKLFKISPMSCPLKRGTFFGAIVGGGDVGIFGKSLKLHGIFS